MTGIGLCFRIIQEQIKKPLAEELLFGKLTDGGVVKIDFKKDELKFDIKPEKQKQKKSVDKEKVE